MNITGASAWITSQRQARGACQQCGIHPYTTEWATTGLLLCTDCCEGRRAVYGLRMDLITAGVTATSPARLDAEAEQIAREERWT